MRTRTEQTIVMLTKEEKNLLEKLAEQMKGTQSQILRLALSKYVQNLALENATTN